MEDSSFSSARLLFRKFTYSDINNYMRLLMSEDVMKYITGKALSGEESRMKFEKVMKINNGNLKSGYFTVHTKTGDAFIGLAKLVYTENEEAEIGYTLLPEFWGKKYATEIIESLIRLAFMQGDIKMLTAITDPENTASIKVLTKHNFELYKKGFSKELPSEWYRLKLDNEDLK